jgi:hypothetical protein
VRREEAMGLLELSAGAGEDEVKAAYRRLAREAHPDTGPEPDPERLRQLGEAREAALEEAVGKDVVTKEDLALILRAQSELAKVSRESEATVSRVVLHHVGKLAALRNRQLTFSGLGTVIGVLFAAVGAAAQSEAVPQLQAVLIALGSLLAICSLITGAMAQIHKSREERLRLEIEEAAETLADRGAFLGTLAGLGLEGFFTREDLQESIRFWSEGYGEFDVIGLGESLPLSAVAARIGRVDFARLLLAKGLESEMIVEAEELGDEGERRYGYRRA